MNLEFGMGVDSPGNVSCFLNYSWQRCRCILILFFHIQIFSWFNFPFVAKLFYMKIGKSSNSAQLVVQMLFWNRCNQESAGRVYFNISGEKPAHARHAARSTAFV